MRSRPSSTAVVAGLDDTDAERRVNAPSTAGRILVVDDNPVNRSLLVRFLVGDGHQPIEADSGDRR